jgi:RNA polymerase sigma factor (sigma-70 family)
VACSADDITRLFEEHYGWLCRVVVRLLRDRDRAQEIVQDVFVEVYAARERIELLTAPAYLKKAVVNRTLTVLTRQRREAELLGQLDRTDTTAGPEQRVPLEQMVLGLVRQLPPQQQIAVVLRYYNDLSEAEIAEMMSVALGTVKGYLFRARDRLARELPDLGDGQ